MDVVGCIRGRSICCGSKLKEQQVGKSCSIAFGAFESRVPRMISRSAIGSSEK